MGVQDQVWERTGKLDRWPWKWIEIFNRWVDEMGGISRMKQRSGIREAPKNQWVWPYLWLKPLEICSMKRLPTVARQEPQWSNKNTYPPTKLSTQNYTVYCCCKFSDQNIPWQWKDNSINMNTYCVPSDPIGWIYHHTTIFHIYETP